MFKYLLGLEENKYNNPDVGRYTVCPISRAQLPYYSYDGQDLLGIL